MKRDSSPIDMNFDFYNWIQAPEARFSIAVRLDCTSKTEPSIIAPIDVEEEKYLRILKTALCRIYPD